MKYNVDQFIKDRFYYKNELKKILDDFNEVCKPILIDIFETIIKYREIFHIYASEYPLFEDFGDFDYVDDNDGLKCFSIYRCCFRIFKG